MAHRMTTRLLSVLFFAGAPALAQAPDEAEIVLPEPTSDPSSEASDDAREAEADAFEPEGAADEADEHRPSESDESVDEPAQEGDQEEPTDSERPTDPAVHVESPQPMSEPPETNEAAESRKASRAEEDAPVEEEGAPSDERAQDDVKLQKPFARQGEFVALGAHFGMATADDKDYGMRKLSFGPAFTLRLGEAIVDWADIGLEFGFGLQGGEEKLTSGRIIAHTRLYPVERLFIHTGFGFGFAGGPDPEEPEFSRFRYGDVYVLGVGTNLYLRDRNKSGGPMFSPSLTFELGPDRELTTGVVWLGAEFSWWAGLRRHQLDLPIDGAYSRSPGD